MTILRRFFAPTLASLLLAGSAFAHPTAPPPEEAVPAVDIPIADTAVYPESISADSSGTLYLGSIKGVIFRALPGVGEAQPWIRPDAANGLLSILGVLVDEKSNTLWVCSSPAPFRSPPAIGVSALVAFDLSSGKFKASHPLPSPAAACNDIAVDDAGTVYATDTPNGRILTLAPGGNALAPFAQDAKLRGVDGIAFAGDGLLYVNNVITQKMLRVNRGADGAFAGLTELTLSQPVKGPDGLRPIAGNRFLQAEGGAGRITEVTISGDAAEITELRGGLTSSPGVTLSGQIVYALEGKIGYLVDPKLKGQDPGPFVIRAIPYMQGSGE